MLTDTHAHLDFPQLAAELDGVLARAEAAGVRRIISIGTSLESSRRAVALAERHPNIWATVGIHPTNVTPESERDLPALRELAQHPRVVAIGEIGLDYHWLPGAVARREGKLTDENAGDFEKADAADRARQSALFVAQWQIAEELGLNVVIHQRAAWEDVLAHVQASAKRCRAVWHCFTEPPQRAEAIFELGHLVSFTGIVTFKNARELHATVASAPGDRFMVETDSPYLAPIPHRGKRCEPAYTRLVAEEVARLRGVPLEVVARETEETAEAFFWGN